MSNHASPSYRGEEYLDFAGVLAFCRELAAAHPDWVAFETIGRSHRGRPIPLLTIGARDGHAEDRPGFWLDGGTHAAEWTGVMSCLFTASRWVESLAAEDPAATARFRRQTAYVAPCISPDGFQAMMEGSPFIRSSLRPPRPGSVRIGLEPRDIDGDGVCRWMRWRHPAGPWAADSDVPLLMRPRRVQDDPAEAFFMSSEGTFLSWDGVRWTEASLRFGMDLNRNFPLDWRPFAMFGMDGGPYPLSEPESRAVVEAFAARRHIAAAVTNHTYTGCLITVPHRQDDPLSPEDIALVHNLARDVVADTDYRVFKGHPEFEYDPKNPISGVWGDTLAVTFGVAGYTLELWDPWRYAGVEAPAPTKYFRDPDAETLRPLLEAFTRGDHDFVAWRPFEHPQLGPVEIGGIDYLRTVRNPPVRELAAECERGFKVADRTALAMPNIQAQIDVTDLGAGHKRVRLVLENTGYLPTSSLPHAAREGMAPPMTATLEPGVGVSVVDGALPRELEHADGWGQRLVAFGRLSIYPELPARGGHRSVATWLVRGAGEVCVTWHASRGGRGDRIVAV